MGNEEFFSGTLEKNITVGPFSDTGTQNGHDGFSARHGRIRLPMKKADAYGLKRTQSTSMWLPLRMLT
jgi:hypothetical protein